MGQQTSKTIFAVKVNNDRSLELVSKRAEEIKDENEGAQIDVSYDLDNETGKETAIVSVVVSLSSTN